MKYWIYADNEVKGPFDRPALEGQPGYGPSSLVCPETAGGGKADGWKPASSFPDLSGPAAPVPAPAKAPPAESPLLMTMRGTLISDPVVDGKVVETPAPAAAPAAAPSPAKAPPAESPLMMTMRGTLISDPVVDGKVAEAPAQLPPGAAKPPLPAARPQAAAGPAPQDGELGKISASLAAIADTQAKLLARMESVEKAVRDMRTLLFPSAPEK